MDKLNIQKCIIFFDLETTGLDLNKDHIIQFAAVKVFPNGTRDEVNIFIDPLIPIKPEATEVHGIKNSDLVGFPIFEDVAAEINNFIGDADLAGYNIIPFDLPLLIQHLESQNITLDISNRHIVDLYKIYIGLRPANLVTAYNEYVGGTFKAHDAAGDAMATYELAVKMFDKESKTLGNSVQEWEAFSFDRSKMVDFAGKFIRNDEGEICFNVGKDKGRPVKENLSFLKWMLDKEFPNDTKNWARRLLNS